MWVKCWGKHRAHWIDNAGMVFDESRTACNQDMIYVCPNIPSKKSMLVSSGVLPHCKACERRILRNGE